MTARSIYVVKSDPGPGKIGIAIRVNQRFSTLKTSSPFPLSLSYTGETDADVYALEQKAHEILADNRMSGEWFNVTTKEAVQAVLTAASELGIVLTQPPPKARLLYSGKKRGRPKVDSQQITFRVSDS